MNDAPLTVDSSPELLVRQAIHEARIMRCPKRESILNSQIEIHRSPVALHKLAQMDLEYGKLIRIHSCKSGKKTA